MNITFPMSPVQKAYVTDRHRYVGLISGIGGGKTTAEMIKALLKTQEMPGILGCITAPTYPMLRDATKRTFFEYCPRELIVYRNDSENEVGIRAGNGMISPIIFRSTSDPDLLRGFNAGWICMDEAAISSFEAFQILQGRIRAGDPELQQLFLGTTPRGFNWVYDYFGPNQKNPEYATHYASTRDNIFLSDSFVHSIYEQYKGTFALQELEGRFVAFEGLIYGDLFKPEMHVGYFPFNEDLPVDLAWDFGYPSAEAVLAIQQDGVGNVYIIDEIYHTKTLTEDIVAEMKAKPWYSNVRDGVGDEARPDNIKRVNDLGVPLRPSRKGKIIDGIKLVRSLLSLDRATQKSMFHVDKKCEMLCKEFGFYRWSDKNTITGEYSDKPIDSWNHALDALRMWAVLKWRGVPVMVVPSDRLVRPKRRIMPYQFLGKSRKNR